MHHFKKIIRATTEENVHEHKEIGEGRRKQLAGYKDTSDSK